MTLLRRHACRSTDTLDEPSDTRRRRCESADESNADSREHRQRARGDRCRTDDDRPATDAEGRQLQAAGAHRTLDRLLDDEPADRKRRQPDGGRDCRCRSQRAEQATATTEQRRDRGGADSSRRGKRESRNGWLVPAEIAVNTITGEERPIQHRVRRQSTKRNRPETAERFQSRSAAHGRIVDLPGEEVARVRRHETVQLEDDLCVVGEWEIANILVPRYPADEGVNFAARASVERGELGV